MGSAEDQVWDTHQSERARPGGPSFDVPVTEIIATFQRSSRDGVSELWAELFQQLAPGIFTVSASKT